MSFFYRSFLMASLHNQEWFFFFFLLWSVDVWLWYGSEIIGVRISRQKCGNKGESEEKNLNTREEEREVQ
ncbi:hypothetical protein YC2023_119565 [Brassica napus]